MKRFVLLIVAALALSVPASLSARTIRAHMGFSYWQVVSASGSVVMHLSGTEPDVLQVEASVTAHWQTTRSVDRLTFPWPARPVGRLKDTETFTDLEKVKGTIIGSAKGTTLGAQPQAFACNREDRQAPAEFFNLPGQIPITGGSLGGATLGIGVQHVNPYVVFTPCKGPNNLPVSTTISDAQIDWTKATFKPVPAGMLRHGKKGQQITLVIRETAPVVFSGESTPIGTAVSTATLHLRFVNAF